MARPFNISDLEAKQLLAVMDSIMTDNVDGNEVGDEEFYWMTTRAAGKVFINHMRDKLETFIYKTHPRKEEL